MDPSLWGCSLTCFEHWVSLGYWSKSCIFGGAASSFLDVEYLAECSAFWSPVLFSFLIGCACSHAIQARASWKTESLKEENNLKKKNPKPNPLYEQRVGVLKHKKHLLETQRVQHKHRKSREYSYTAAVTHKHSTAPPTSVERNLG